MTNILHLTDLHLDEDQCTTDDKKNLIPIDEKETRFNIYKRAINKFLNSLGNDKLDVLIISGDITVRNQEKGFELFNLLIKSLDKDKLPPKNKIIIVPGNHDVDWFAQPSSKEKYKNFRNYIQKHGYFVPFLDGVEHDDFPNFGILNLEDKNIQIVPINSSNYCGISHSIAVSENEISSAKKILEENGKAKILELYEKQMLYDMARISPQQINKLEESINADTNTLKIAVLHHNLFPVSSLEEIKPFESLTNLGFFYKFLKTYNFKLALHGHKHQSLVSWCLIPNYNEDYNELEKQHKILTISGSTVPFKEFSEVKEIGKHIIISDDNLNIEIKTLFDSVLSLDNIESHKKIYSFNSANKTNQNIPSITNFISGENLDETYSKILDFFTPQSNKILNNIICEIKQIPKDFSILPKNYPYLGDETQKTKKVKDIVGWWSKKHTNAEDFIPITHGKRIYNYYGENQIDRVVKILPKEKNSSRGIVTLIDPRVDDLTDGLSYAPHFMSIQFILDEKTDENINYLDSIAYFRKQEMHHWWAINVAEIIKLMIEVKDKIISNDRDRKIELRKITTISAIAYFGEGASKLAVSVPKIDMLYDAYESDFISENELRLKRKPKIENINLWHMVFSLFNKLDENLNKKCKLEWLDVLDDLKPSGTKDPNKVPISIIGLKFTIGQLHLHNSFFKNGEIYRLIDLFEKILKENKNFKHFSSQKDKNINEHYDYWRETSIENIEEIKLILEKIY